MTTAGSGREAGAPLPPPALPVVLDVMGGDTAPGPTLEAAPTLLDCGIPVLLCGPEALLEGTGLPVLGAPEWVGMDEDPAFAMRTKPRSSLRVAAQAVADGRAGAMVSAGSTGAVVAAALLHLGRSPGVRRPVIAARIPTSTGHVLLLDVGATPDADAATLVANVHLGLSHARAQGRSAPTAALLNMGREPNKGPQRVRQAAALLAGVPGFRGSVEPADVLAGAVDVVVVDGFTGNVLLKAVEATADTGRVGDAAALVLGVAGTVLVSHGAATAAQLVSAIRMADGLARERLGAATSGEQPAQTSTT